MRPNRQKFFGSFFQKRTKLPFFFKLPRHHGMPGTLPAARTFSRCVAWYRSNIAPERIFRKQTHETNP